jgi:hypothetical protein
MNVLETLEETINDAHLTNKISDRDVIELLKFNLCFKASDESYEAWKKLGWIETVEVNNESKVKVLGVKEIKNKEMG